MSNSAAWSPKPAVGGMCQEDSRGCWWAAPGPASAGWGTAQCESGAGPLLQGSPPGCIYSDGPPTKGDFPRKDSGGIYRGGVSSLGTEWKWQKSPVD